MTCSAHFEHPRRPPRSGPARERELSRLDPVPIRWGHPGRWRSRSLLFAHPALGQVFVSGLVRKRRADLGAPFSSSETTRPTTSPVVTPFSAPRSPNSVVSVAIRRDAARLLTGKRSSIDRNVSPRPVMLAGGGSGSGARAQPAAMKSAGRRTSPRASASAAARRYFAGSMPWSFAVSMRV